MNLARKDHEVRRTGDGFSVNYRWTDAYVAVSHMRIADPDSAARLFRIDTLHAVESVPTFRWRNVKATVRQLGDSVWIDAPHFDLPASTGHAAGKVVWGSDLPVRFAIRIWGDSVSLNDVAWVYPTLPRTGGGTMILDIKNERNLKQLDYAITDMDVRTTKSRLLGDITFEVGGPVLAVHDVKMRADPVDFDLLRTLNGKPFPADWQGSAHDARKKNRNVTIAVLVASCSGDFSVGARIRCRCSEYAMKNAESPARLPKMTPIMTATAINPLSAPFITARVFIGLAIKLRVAPTICMVLIKKRLLNIARRIVLSISTITAIAITSATTIPIILAIRKFFCI